MTSFDNSRITKRRIRRIKEEPAEDIFTTCSRCGLLVHWENTECLIWNQVHYSICMKCQPDVEQLLFTSVFLFGK
jgi:hypothetical protein